ncbi:non-heme iron oxygenase ferredoxin subunit [Nocardioides antri]|uniref:Non-heme iron oxygenase ferredoxin subunit n=1 Tax=Nocardioides antri TaxID=2607659 RepID=A0A5B1M7M2_9ACTN|nr:non-heme iron oxygenase ferredoxin subunit [Nocardioides antri]KAA1429265.1 non-heme iron oxygenase ferredoxin subunit [Nocardioides antri]
MSFERACALADVPEDEALAVTVGEYDVAVAKIVHSDGGVDFYALQNQCSHAAVSLSEGEVENGTVECWLHGSCFDLRTGKPTHLPATEPVATFPVAIQDDERGVASLYVDVTTTLNGVTPA